MIAQFLAINMSMLSCEYVCCEWVSLNESWVEQLLKKIPRHANDTNLS